MYESVNFVHFPDHLILMQGRYFYGQDYSEMAGMGMANHWCVMYMPLWVTNDVMSSILFHR